VSKHLPAPLSAEVVAYLLQLKYIVVFPDNPYVIVVQGRTLYLTDSQVGPWKVMYENFLQGNVPISHKRVTNGEVSMYQLFFKRCPEWRAVFRCRNGMYWLHVPEGLLLEAVKHVPQPAAGVTSVRRPDGFIKESTEGVSVSRNRAFDSLREMRSLLGYQVISIKMAACFAGVSAAHMYRAARGQLPNTPPLMTSCIGRRVLTRTDWLDEWMRASRAMTLQPRGPSE